MTDDDDGDDDDGDDDDGDNVDDDPYGGYMKLLNDTCSEKIDA